MMIGIDFDNTIICYDDVFYNVALERNRIPQSMPKNKQLIRDYLRKQGYEEDWTEMQGYVYGKRIIDARPYDGVIQFFQYCKNKHIPIHIISHKTKTPYAGKQYNLHDAAYNWFARNGFFDQVLTIDQISFLQTKQEKLQKISDFQCSHFIDDLPEVLNDQNFPDKTIPILFDPQHLHTNCLQSFIRKQNWNDICSYFCSLIT
jgi:hypothetical protein